MLIISSITQNSRQNKISSFVWRGLHSSTTFGWLLALAVSSRVLYPEPIQLSLFVIFFTYAWSLASLRESILASLATLLSRTEGKLLLLLLVCILISTASTATKWQQPTMWLNFFLLLVGTLASCSCLSLLGQSNYDTRRIFRIVTACFTVSMLVWLILLLLVIEASPQINYSDNPYLKSWFLYLLYSQSGMPILFIPLVIAAFSRHGIGSVRSKDGSSIGATTNGNSRLFWRVCIILGLSFFLLCAELTWRRIVILAVLVAAAVAITAFLGKKKINFLLLLLAATCILGLSLLLIYSLRGNASIYTDRSELCVECNELFLPWWLVDNVRQFAWRETIMVWLENPWFGRGVHNDLTSFHHPHSRFLQILSGLGIVGFSVFACLLVLLLAGNFLQWRNKRQLSSLSMLLVHSVYWSIGIFELSVWSIWHFWIYICALVLSLSLDRLPLDELSAKSQRVRQK